MTVCCRVDGRRPRRIYVFQEFECPESHLNSVYYVLIFCCVCSHSPKHLTIFGCWLSLTLMRSACRNVKIPVVIGYIIHSLMFVSSEWFCCLLWCFSCFVIATSDHFHTNVSSVLSTAASKDPQAMEAYLRRIPIRLCTRGFPVVRFHRILQWSEHSLGEFPCTYLRDGCEPPAAMSTTSSAQSP